MTGSPAPAAQEELFARDPEALRIHERIGEVLGELTDLETRVNASQIAYRHGRTFALVWPPGRYVRSDVPLVLSLVLREPLESARVKETVKVARDAWMHHLEIRSVDEVDDEVRAWIRQAWESADRRVRQDGGRRG